MVELCNYCGKLHETGGEFSYGGIQMKVCPEIPKDNMFLFDPQQFGEMSDVMRIVNVGASPDAKSEPEPSS